METAGIKRQLEPGEVAAILGLGRQATYEWLRNAATPAYKVGRLWKCDPDALREWITRQSAVTEQETKVIGIRRQRGPQHQQQPVVRAIGGGSFIPYND